MLPEVPGLRTLTSETKVEKSCVVTDPLPVSSPSDDALLHLSNVQFSPPVPNVVQLKTYCVQFNCPVPWVVVFAGHGEHIVVLNVVE